MKNISKRVEYLFSLVKTGLDPFHDCLEQFRLALHIQLVVSYDLNQLPALRVQELAARLGHFTKIQPLKSKHITSV